MVQKPLTRLWVITMKISINVPSYKRPKVKTLEYLPFARVWVAESELKAYQKANPKADIVSVPDKVQGNLCRVRNYIMDKCKDDDVCLIIDDDYTGVYYWEHEKKHLVKSDEFLDFIAKYSLLAKEWGVKFWGLNVNPDRQIYRTYSPFSTTSYIGGPFQCFLKGNELRYDERFPLKEDYDMTLQQLNKYRCVLRLNKFFYVVQQADQAGGCANYRNFHKEESQLIALQKKWGSKIVKFDNFNRSHNLKSAKTHIDFNPVITPPIKGI